LWTANDSPNRHGTFQPKSFSQIKRIDTYSGSTVVSSLSSHTRSPK